MLPIRDNAPRRRFPLVTSVLLAVNLAVFVYTYAAGPAALRLLETWALVPWRLFTPPAWTGAEPLTLVTSTFLHGGWLHVGGNMLYLWVFGDNIEDRLGRWRFLGFYLFVGALAGLIHALTVPASPVPTIGASGAVAGVLGAYLVAFPRARVLTLIPLGPLVTAVRIPALAYLGFWFLLQLLAGLGAGGAVAQPVAWWAHVAGFLAGAGLMRGLYARLRIH